MATAGRVQVEPGYENERELNMLAFGEGENNGLLYRIVGLLCRAQKDGVVSEDV